jgi:hypothetical protein
MAIERPPMPTDKRMPAGRRAYESRDRVAPNHLSKAKSPADAASNAPMPSMESVIAVKSTSATPTAMGRAARQPGPEHMRQPTGRLVREQISKAVEAAANVAHTSMLMTDPMYLDT